MRVIHDPTKIIFYKQKKIKHEIFKMSPTTWFYVDHCKQNQNCMNLHLWWYNYSVIFYMKK